MAGNTLAIRWRRDVISDPVRIDICRDYPGSWTSIAAAVADTLFNWTATGPTTANARLRIVSTVDPNLGDTTAASFTILVPQLVLSPLGGTRFPIGFPVHVSWWRTAVPEPVNLYLSRDGGVTWPETVGSSLTTDSLLWTPSGAAASQARLKVQSSLNSQINAQSDVFVLAQPQLAMTYPVGMEVFATGSTIMLRWQRTDHPAAVNVEIMRDYPSGSWQPLLTDVNSDSAAWTASGPDVASVRLRVVSTVNSSWQAQSGTFSIYAAAVRITSPVSGRSMNVGDPVTLVWQRTAYPAPVRVLFRRLHGPTDTLAASSLASELSFTARAPEGDSSWMVVEGTAGGTPRDSVLSFGPYVPRISLVSPADGALWVADQSQVLRWNRQHAAGQVVVSINRTYPSGNWETVSNTANDSAVYIPRGAETNSLALAVGLGSQAGGERCAFPGALKPTEPALPQQKGVAVRVGYSHDRIIKRCKDMHLSRGQGAFSFFAPADRRAERTV